MPVKRYLPYCAATMLAIVVVTVGGRNRADQPSAGVDDIGNAPLVAMLNVGYVFENYPPLTEAILERKAEVDEAEAAVRARQQEIEDKRAQLAVLEVGSATHTALTKDIASAFAQLTADVEVQKQLFLRKEASIYLRVFEEMEAACEAYARPRGLGMIMRFNDAPVDRNDPQDVLRCLNRPIIWHDGRLDITRAVLEIMKANAADAP